MGKEYVIDNNKIGSAIQYIRESFHISQSKLCKGLCSITTLSRIEAGERDVDSFLLETLLERLGKTPNQFELILTDLDYELYLSREEIKKKIGEKNNETALSLLEEYELLAASKGNVHMQFIITCKALLNELNSGAIEDTIKLFLDAIACTVPGFKTKEIKHYYLSASEVNIIIDVTERMITAGMTDQAKDLLLKVIEYLEGHDLIEEINRFYPRVAIIASKLYIQEEELVRAFDMCTKGLLKNKGNRKMDYLGDLIYLKAYITEKLMRIQGKWEQSRLECIELYLQAYYVFYFCEDIDRADKIKQYLQEEYKWEDIV